MPSRPAQFHARPQRDRATLKVEQDERRGSARQRGYSAAWDDASAIYRKQHPLCLGCEAIGRVSAAELTDHVEPHKGDPVLFWNAANWQPSCRWHHDVIKQRLELQFAKGQLKAADLKLDSAAATRLSLEHVEIDA